MRKVRIHLASQFSSRDGKTDTDARLVNCIVEKTAAGLQITKRPCLSKKDILRPPGLPEGSTGYGMWSYSTNIFPTHRIIMAYNVGGFFRMFYVYGEHEPIEVEYKDGNLVNYLPNALDTFVPRNGGQTKSTEDKKNSTKFPLYGTQTAGYLLLSGSAQVQDYAYGMLFQNGSSGFYYNAEPGNNKPYVYRYPFRYASLDLQDFKGNWWFAFSCQHGEGSSSFFGGGSDARYVVGTSALTGLGGGKFGLPEPSVCRWILIQDDGIISTMVGKIVDVTNLRQMAIVGRYFVLGWGSAIPPFKARVIKFPTFQGQGNWYQLVPFIEGQDGVAFFSNIVMEAVYEAAYTFNNNVDPPMTTYGTTTILIPKSKLPGGSLYYQIYGVNVSQLTVVPGIEQLDGTSYIVQENSIYGSTLGKDTPQKGPVFDDPNNVIKAVSYPDPIIYITRQLSYLIAIKRYSVEFFYDRGNPSGSVLSRLDGYPIAFSNIGCLDYRSVQNTGDLIFFLGNTKAGGHPIFCIDAQQVKQISTEAIDRVVYEQMLTYQTISSWQIRFMGHLLYGLTIGAVGLVYDHTMGTWYEWYDENGQPLRFTGCCYGFDGEWYMQHINGDIVQLSMDTYSENGKPIECMIVTDPLDCGGINRKHLASLDIIGDTAQSEVIVSMTDDDYETWDTERRLDMSYPLKRLVKCGSFERRAFKFTHRADTRFRVSGLELTVSDGAP